MRVERRKHKAYAGSDGCHWADLSSFRLECFALWTAFGLDLRIMLVASYSAQITALLTMKTKHELELSDVKKIAAAAEAEALKHNWAVTIAIVDDGGHLLWLQRLDGSAPISAHMAPAKARSAALGRKDTKLFEDMINNGRTAFLSAPYVDGLLEGGVAIVKDGQCLGAVGVSGVKSNEDAQVASAGIAALGL